MKHLLKTERAEIRRLLDFGFPAREIARKMKIDQRRIEMIRRNNRLGYIYRKDEMSPYTPTMFSEVLDKIINKLQVNERTT